MSSGYVGKKTNHPDTSVGARAQAEREDQWGNMPGRVVSFDPATQTATVQPLFKPRHNGQPVDMPQLLEVPVRFMRAGGFVITTPVKPGDKVELRPQARSSANYHTGDGGAFAPADSGSFSLSDMEAHLTGGESLAEPIPAFNNEALELRSADGSFKMQMTEDGKFRFVGSMGELFDVLATALEALATDQLQIAYGSSAGTGHAMANAATYAAQAAKLRGMIS